MVEKQSIPLKIRLIAHIETWRPYTVIWCGLLSFLGACLTNKGLPQFPISILSLIIPIFGWISGLYLADYLDQDLDKIEKSHRPIPSGRMKPLEALLTGGLFVVCGTILTIFLRIENIIFIFIAGFLVYSYSKYTKSQGFYGNLNRGFLALTTYYFGVFSIGLSLSEIPNYIWLLSIVFLFHDMNTNIIGTLRDIKGDKEAGYHTIPVKYGLKNSLIFTSALSISWLTLTLTIPLYYRIFTIPFYLIMIIDMILLGCIFLYSYQLLKKYSRKKALEMHKLFVLERITLASAFLFLFIDSFIAIFIYVVCLLLTAIFQIILRNQYEFNKWTL